MVLALDTFEVPEPEGWLLFLKFLAVHLDVSMFFRPGYSLSSGVFTECRGELRALLLVYEKENMPGPGISKLHLVHCGAVPAEALWTLARQVNWGAVNGATTGGRWQQ